MRYLLVGSTGFVGRNLLSKHNFFLSVHSTDIYKAYGMRPDICIYAGVPSAMFLANENPKADQEIMKVARENLRRIAPKKVVLISTIAVYSDCVGKDEEFEQDEKILPVYGKNRLQLEKWVKEDHKDVLIIRLPALYGKYLKKNFLYDLRHIVPRMLTVEKYEEISMVSLEVKEAYIPSGNGYYILKDDVNFYEVKRFFKGSHFSALSFTDSRSMYQFYSLERLWADIKIVLDIGEPIVNLVPPPVRAVDIYKSVTGKDDWVNMLDDIPFQYDIRTKYASSFGGQCGYICTVDEEMEDICRFMKGWNMDEA